ncbi:HisA/HisF-related TIM barrel protein [Streptomyces iconiensis]|uniref:HisA/HisF-related TIM barrel protein n=1 Tax=Streptomyces iconiensis TaxID=1384038 RepID=A0ABT7A2W3_9ACTN|nr:HisA/HisF-related TIM barrel protein [Streptomyces iconiensis]MDJ1135660.1 HisA/HisF-related TIM barrel protein [Streptomyces iconiensis]
MTSQTTPFADRRTQLADLVIPCIDVVHGEATPASGISGLSDPGDVAGIAGRYAEDGATKLFVDVLDAWHECPYLPSLLHELKRTGMAVLVSVQQGRLPSVAGAGTVLEAGADVLSVSTSVIEDRERVVSAVRQYGGERFMGVLNCASDGAGGWLVRVEGGTQDTGVQATAVATGLGQLGVAAVLANSLDREGTSDGYDMELTRAIARASGLPTIASGGAGTADHLWAALRAGEAAYVLVNKMVHSGHTSVAALRDEMLARWSTEKDSPCAP